ncbi:hypothetical protein YC2023_037423 [Brassica napus]|uniref:Uncharacterized protein n=1 Tax=Brassica oleracea TaxID=3712 RepID=A0A3P6B545_BRAOL|nr:unnamed protein product [Brassica oleracea]
MISSSDPLCSAKENKLRAVQDVTQDAMFWEAPTASGFLGLAISFTSMWFLHQTGPTTYILVVSFIKVPISLSGLVLFDVPLSLPNLFSIHFGKFICWCCLCQSQNVIIVFPSQSTTRCKISGPMVSPFTSLASGALTANPPFKGELKWVLTACAKVISENNLLTARWCMGVLRSMVSISGKPIQCLGGYMLEGFLARVAATGSIYKYLRSIEPESYDFVSYGEKGEAGLPNLDFNGRRPHVAEPDLSLSHALDKQDYPISLCYHLFIHYSDHKSGILESNRAFTQRASFLQNKIYSSNSQQLETRERLAKLLI